jgi:hypothetical protein
MTTHKIYKFLHSHHLSRVLEGTIRIGSLSHYRSLEGEQWIADRLEGSVEFDPQGMVITEEDNKLDPMLPPSLAGRHVKVSVTSTLPHCHFLTIHARAGTVPAVIAIHTTDRTYQSRNSPRATRNAIPPRQLLANAVIAASRIGSEVHPPSAAPRG